MELADFISGHALTLMLFSPGQASKDAETSACACLGATCASVVLVPKSAQGRLRSRTAADMGSMMRACSSDVIRLLKLADIWGKAKCRIRKYAPLNAAQEAETVTQSSLKVLQSAKSVSNAPRLTLYAELSGI